MPRFILMEGRHVIRVYQVTADKMLVGRHHLADIILDNLMVSREHAEIRKEGASYFITNKAGKNGMFINGQWVDTHPLKDGDVVEIGKYALKFEYPAEERRQHKAVEKGVKGAGFRISAADVHSRLRDPAEVVESVDDVVDDAAVKSFSKLKANQSTYVASPKELAGVRQKLHDAKKAHLVLTSSPGKQTFFLEATATRIGRGEDCEVKLDTGWLAPKVSAEIVRGRKGFVLRVIKGNVRVNGKKIEGETPLRDQQVIEVEAHKLKFYDLMQG